MKKNFPLTKGIAFARLDKRLSEEDKKSILKVRNMIVRITGTVHDSSTQSIDFPNN